LRHKVAIRFVIEEDLRFISHHDMARLFQRAVSRVQLPVKFSGGFNPRPKLSLPLPRPVGVASEAELLVVELAEPVQPERALAQLARVLPAGLKLTEARMIEGGRSPQAESVEYAVDLPAEHLPAVEQALHRLLAAETWRIERTGPADKPGRTIDLKAYLVDASIDRERVRWTVRVTDSGSIRPAEVLAAIGLDPGSWHHRVRRTAINWRKQAATDKMTGPDPSTRR